MLPQFLIDPPLQVNSIFPVDTTIKNRKESKLDKTKIGVGNSIIAKVGDIDEKIRVGKIRRMRKELAGWM